jgi:predicted short-subunit dehydrogenase-like oxidoreductase (DUF2520 family)
MDQKCISFAGSGKVATPLCRELFRSGFSIDMVYSRNRATGNELALSCNSVWSATPDFPPSTEIIIVAVPDDELPALLASIKCERITIVAHTAGSIGLDVFPPETEHKGVIYPLQTFSEGRKIDFRQLPFFIESSDNYTGETLRYVAEKISSKVSFMEVSQRRIIHLAAIFVNNFTNHMLTLGKELTDRNNTPFEIMGPLLMETVSKALENGPENSQTGPAVRHDIKTIEKHLELLSFSHDLQEIYRELTRSINDYYKK